MSRTTVGILRGGTSSEYPYSLKTGAAMMNALSPESYDVRDIYIDKNGLWYMRGMPVDAARALSQIDVVLNALHGGVGEDGSVARVLERAGVPYVGSGPLPSVRTLNKISFREALQSEGIRIPQGVSFTLSDGLDAGAMAREAFAHVGPPYVVKPAMEGASYGIQYVPSVLLLPDAIANVLEEFGTVVVEEYVIGDEAIVGLIEGFRGEDVYALPPASVGYADDSPHITPRHYAEGVLRHLVPSVFTHEEKNSLMNIARQAHTALGLSHLSRADFIVTKRGPVLLEMDTLPHLYDGAAFPLMLESVGSSLSEMLSHLIARVRA